VCRNGERPRRRLKNNSGNGVNKRTQYVGNFGAKSVGGSTPHTHKTKNREKVGERWWSGAVPRGEKPLPYQKKERGKTGIGVFLGGSQTCPEKRNVQGNQISTKKQIRRCAKINGLAKMEPRAKARCRGQSGALSEKVKGNLFAQRGDYFHWI